MLLLNPEIVSPDIEHFIHDHIDPGYKVGDPLAFSFSEVEVKRGEVITQLGEVPNWAYFLTEGMVKICMPDGQIIDIFQAGEFAASFYAFTHRLPSQVSVIAMRPCTLQRIHIQSITQAFEHDLLTAKLLAKVSIYYYGVMVKKQTEFRELNTEQRLIKLITERRSLYDELKNVEVAKYLGVIQPSFNRVIQDLDPEIAKQLQRPAKKKSRSRNIKK
ncbi:MAG: Crp/Fnr family transcriptional regulator [Chitinophagaceae bacterium]|nr:Crp/Fnr family transcriptional regulator [Chitinophagaceae bacterium]